MPEEENIRIKDYQIHFPPLGEGAYGRVFRATYRGISERALKIFRPGAVDLSNMARELDDGTGMGADGGRDVAVRRGSVRGSLCRRGPAGLCGDRAED
ncbi:MAG: hypothetical protein MI807_11635, partial [Verrucomicrobiales bacterium]|nr:hypothetical protein [Verrucomicrobiales bacterium]